MEQKFKRSFNELKNIVSMTESMFLKEGLESNLRNVVDLATEELFVNMVTYNTESNEDILIQMVSHDPRAEARLEQVENEKGSDQPPAFQLRVNKDQCRGRYGERKSSPAAPLVGWRGR